VKEKKAPEREHGGRKLESWAREVSPIHAAKKNKKMHHKNLAGILEEKDVRLKSREGRGREKNRERGEERRYLAAPEETQNERNAAGVREACCPICKEKKT